MGAYGRQSDGGTFAYSGLGRAICNNELLLPPDRALTNGGDPLPLVFVADEAFPLRSHLSRPFPGRNVTAVKRNLNYRLSRAGRVVENAFGILSQRFRLFQRSTAIAVSYVDEIVKCACALRNFLLPEDNHFQSPADAQDIFMRSMNHVGGNASTLAMAVRDQFASYFATDGALLWQ